MIWSIPSNYIIFKGLSREKDLAFDDLLFMNSFRPKLRTEPFFKFFRCSNDFITQKVHSSGLIGVYISVIMFAAYFCPSRLSQVEYNFSIDKSGFPCCLYCTKSGWRCIIVISVCISPQVVHEPAITQHFFAHDLSL